jgi:hypothetical protein
MVFSLTFVFVAQALRILVMYALHSVPGGADRATAVASRNLLGDEAHHAQFRRVDSFQACRTTDPRSYTRSKGNKSGQLL